jgi:hypothetical protein
MTLGAMHGGKVDMLVTPGPYAADPDVAGVLGVDLLGNFDVELDFAAHKVNLFTSGTCAAGPGPAFTALKMDMGDPASDSRATYRFTTTMMLDGQPLAVAIDTLATAMRLKFDVAKARFGLTESAPGVTPLPARGDSDRKAYAYPFKSLTASGISIDNPRIVLTGDSDAVPCNGATHPRLGALPGMHGSFTCRSVGDMTLGVHWMRKMHWYFAYKAGTIYFAEPGTL